MVRLGSCVDRFESSPPRIRPVADATCLRAPMSIREIRVIRGFSRRLMGEARVIELPSDAKQKITKRTKKALFGGQNLCCLRFLL